MSVTLKKWLKIAAIVIVILVVITQAYKLLYSPFTTETVTAVSYYDGIDVVGLVIRDETVIESDVSGVISYPLTEGSRVSSGGTVANVFSSKEAADAYIRVENIDEEIATLKDTQTYNDLYAADVSLLDTKIYTSLYSLLDDKQGIKKTFDTTADTDLCNYLNRKQIVTGTTSDFNARVAALEAEKASLSTLYKTNIGSITSPVSGYFISVVDGWENVVSVDELDSLTPEKFETLSPGTPSEKAICKVVTDYKWYIAVTVPLDYSLSLSIGQSMTLRTSLDGYTDLPVSVKSINRTAGNSNAVIVFTCKIMSEEIAGFRTMPVTVVKEKYSGLKVSNEAIRASDGVFGVYVYASNQMTFVPVNVLYTGKYSIVEKQISEDKVLRLYDVVIVKGRDLADGKIVD